MQTRGAAAMLAWAVAATTGLCCGPFAPQAGTPAKLQRVARDQMCVTNGVIVPTQGGVLAIATPSSRAVVPGAAAQSAELHFRYMGPSDAARPLASGELRRQIGLKLKAQDSCNLLYAMWHIAPDSTLAVSVKHNPGLHTHAQCGAHGYVSVPADLKRELPTLSPGESHTLRADLRGDRLTLMADGQVAWEGSVGAHIAEFDGPVGLRTDNGRFELQVFAALGDPLRRAIPLAYRCSNSPGD
jgi:hypothetical protein